MAIEKTYVAHPSLVGGGEITLHSHAGGGGLATYSVENEADDSSSSTSWQSKLVYTVVEAGDYIVQWYFELYGSNISYHCCSQVLHNSAQLGNVQWESEDINPAPWQSGGGLKKLTLAVNDTIEIQYCSENSSGIAHIRYARIFLVKL